MIKIFALRPFTKNGKIELSHKELLSVTSYEELLSDTQFFIEKIPVSERYNVFATFSECTTRDTAGFISQRLIPIDIDGIDYTKIPDYLTSVEEVLKINIQECTVVATGNGLHILVGLSEKITDVKFFQKYRKSYKELCKKINENLVSKGLVGEADSDILKPGTMLRLPLTMNRKPMNTPFAADTVIKKVSFIANNLKFVHDIKSILKEEALPLVKEKKEKENYPKPEAEAVFKGCNFLQHCYNNQETLDEPTWYVALGVTAFLQDEDETTHRISSKHSDYSREAVDAKAEQARNSSKPRTCEDINSRGEWCKGCKYIGAVRTPVKITNRMANIPNDVEDAILVQEEIKMSKSLVASFKGNLLQKDGVIFVFNGKFWETVPKNFEILMKEKIDSCFTNPSPAKVRITYGYFKEWIPHAEDQQLTSSNPYLVNFLDGTLELKNKTELVFREHRREDYMVNMLSVSYEEAVNADTSPAEEMLLKIFDGDEDKDEKLRTIAQIYGAILMPIYPHFWVLLGVAGSGKSTICKIAAALAGEKNICDVQPHQFNGFHMESMVGKLINIVTDIESNAVISDSMIKQIEDRRPIGVQRKYMPTTMVPLPAIHLYGANELPKNFDGSKKAYTRRFTIVGFNYSFTEKSERENKEFFNDFIKDNLISVAGLAIKGLRDIIALGGNYTTPKSGKRLVNEWQEEYDPVETFLNDIRGGEVKELTWNEEGIIQKLVLWEHFNSWKNETGRNYSKINRNQFYKILRSKKIAEKKDSKTRYFLGIHPSNIKISTFQQEPINVDY